MEDDYQGPQDNPDPKAEDAPEGETDDTASEEGDEDLYIPESALGGKTCKPGDTLTFKVTGKTSYGELKLALDDKEYSGSSNEADAMDLRTALGKS